jgi:hypothetical protein
VNTFSDGDGWRIFVDVEGRVAAVSAPQGVAAEVVDCAQEAFARETFPCLADGEAWWFSTHIIR